MAALTTQQRYDCFGAYMRDSGMGPIVITKPDLLAAVNALDDFLVNNAAAVNNALPAAAKTGLTTAQKALLLMYVVNKRYISGA